jgi:hypothetical protein
MSIDVRPVIGVATAWQDDDSVDLCEIRDDDKEEFF